MNTIITIVQGLLTVIFLLAGTMKLVQTRAKVISSGGKWAQDFSAPVIKLIGVGEVICALGVLIPQLLGQGDYITSAAASGIAVFMAGAFFTHLRRKETPFLAVTGAFFLMAVFVAYSRYPGV